MIAQAFARPLVESEASKMVEEAQVELAGESKLESAGAGLMAWCYLPDLWLQCQ